MEKAQHGFVTEQPAEKQGDSEAVMRWASARGLSRESLKACGVSAATKFFDGKNLPAVVFSYFDENGDTVNWKARAITEKSWTQQGGGTQQAYNIANVLADIPDTVWITEGEIDAVSLVEGGVPINAVLSIPNGAPKEGSEITEKRYQWLYTALEHGLMPVKKFVLAVDDDAPGRVLRQHLLSILGAAKCWFVEWGEVKDANEFLTQYGKDKFTKFLKVAPQPWPIEGVYTLDEIPEAAPLELWDMGFPEFESKMRLAPTMVSCVTGYPGHGKSHLFQQVWWNASGLHHFPVAIFSAETRTKPFLRRNLRQFHHRKLERDMTDLEKSSADDTIRRRFRFIGHDDDRPSVDWLLDMIEVAAIREGCRAVVIDPWNKIEPGYDSRQTTETEWIGRSLDEFIQAARGLNIHIQIIAHPAKPEYSARQHAPDLYAISGSQHWNNRVDQGFVIHREKFFDEGQRKTDAVLIHKKSRFEEMGYPCTVDMKYEVGTGNFRCTEGETMLQTELN